jgi:hypothetical protein
VAGWAPVAEEAKSQGGRQAGVGRGRDLAEEPGRPRQAAHHQHAEAGRRAGQPRLFGFFAHRSRFCLRSAVIEFAPWHARRQAHRLAVHLSTAVLLTQAFIMAGWLDVKDARQLSARAAACRARPSAARCSAWA